MTAIGETNPDDILGVLTVIEFVLPCLAFILLLDLIWGFDVKR